MGRSPKRPQPTEKQAEASVNSLVQLAYQLIDRDFKGASDRERQLYVELYLQRALTEVQG